MEIWRTPLVEHKVVEVVELVVEGRDDQVLHLNLANDLQVRYTKVTTVRRLQMATTD